MINWEVHTLLCSSQFAASPFVTILGCFVSFPLSYFVSAYLSSDSIPQFAAGAVALRKVRQPHFDTKKQPRTVQSLTVSVK